MNIGILYPRSSAHPEAMVDYMDGVKLLLKQKDLTNSIQLFPESIGFGGAEKEVYEKAEKLILLDKVDILVAYVDMRVAGVLDPLMESSGKLLLIVNPGANHPDNWAAREGVIYLTLQHAFLSWLAGSLISKQENKNGLYATTFYDCGYMHGAAMLNAFVANSGNICFNYVNNQAYDQRFEIKQLTDFIAADQTVDNILTVMDDLPASLFYQLLNESEEAGRLNLFVSPMALQSAAIKDINNGFKFSIDGYLPWIVSQENVANKAFTTFYKEEAKHDPSIFSLLGWETGLIIQALVQNGTSDREKAVSNLSAIEIDSPRGVLKLDAPTNHFTAPVHKCRILKNSGKLQTEYQPTMDEEWRAFTAIQNEGTSSGWSNTYLCY